MNQKNDNLNKLKDLLSGLNSDDRKVLELVLQDDSLLNDIIQSEYNFYPISINEFVDDEYYLGDLAKSLYPKLKENLIEIFNGDYYEIIFTGAIGWGKSTLSRAIILRLLYELCCLKNPPKAFGLEEGTYIYFGLMSLTEKLAKPILLEPLFNELKGIGFFVDNCKFDLKNNMIQFFDKNIRIIPASVNNLSVLGHNLIFCMIDEANFVRDVNNKKITSAKIKSKVDIVYDAVVRRIKSRFLFNGKYYGKILLVSSCDEEDSFIDKHIEQVKNNPNVYICNHSVWETKPEGTFSDKKFYVVYSLKDRNFVPKIFETENNELNYYRGQINDYRVIEVPIDFLDEFKSDVYGSLRDLAGVSIVFTDRFISNMDIVMNCIDKKRSHPMESIFYLYNQDKTFAPLIKFHLLTDRGRPIINGDRARFAHIDLGITHDATGITIGHLSHYVYRRRGNQVEGLPYFYIDFILQIVPDKKSQIQLSHIVYLFDLFRNAGFKFSLITMDSYQSFGLGQALNQVGFKTDVLSVDKEPVAYMLLKQAFLERRISLYYYEPLIKELSELIIRQKNKTIMIDHPKYGSKDVADSLAGLIYNLSANGSYSLPIPIGFCKPVFRSAMINNQVIDTEAAELLGMIKQQKEDKPFFSNIIVEDDDDVNKKTGNKNEDSIKYLFNGLPFLRG